MKPLRMPWLAVAFGLVLSGCRSNDADVSDTSASDASVNDAGGSASVLGILACGASIDVACAAPANFGLGSPGGPSSGSGGAANGCVRDWANACDTGAQVARCGQYDVLGTTAVDVGTDYFYDVVTRQLVAVVYWSGEANKSECIAGPPAFTLPRAFTPSLGACMAQTCPDAGSTDEDASVLAAVDAMQSD